MDESLTNSTGLKELEIYLFFLLPKFEGKMFSVVFKVGYWPLQL